MSKAVKTIVSVAAAIAIPFAAPAIASSIGLSAAIGGAVGSAATGSVIGGALTGAALGAAKGAILGEDVGRSALMGGLSGGVGGYTATPTAAPTGVLPPVYDATPAGLTPAPGYSTAGLAMGPQTAQQLGAGFQQQMAAGGILPSTGLSAGLDMGPQTAEQMGTGFEQQMAGAGVVPTPLATPVAGAPAGTAGAAPAGQPTTYSEALKARFTDPKAQADFTLRAAAQLAGSALAGDGLSDEERALLAQQTQELRTLQQENAGLFRQRLEQAQNLIGESRYFDPEYFGLQSARRAQTQSAVAKRAGLRGLTGERRESEARRYDIEGGRRTGTAYDVGFTSAIAPRVQTMQAGLNAMPTAYPSSMGDYTNLRGAYTAANQRARETQGDIGNLFGSLTGSQRSQGRG